MYTFYGNYYVYLCVYIVMSDYLCVYIVMRDYLYLFLINVIIYFYYMLKARKKTDNLRYITLIQLKLKLYICLHGAF